MNKFTILLALLILQTGAIKASAVEKNFSCSSGEISVSLETEPVDPENAAGSMNDERADVAYDIYQTTDLNAPKGSTLYLVDGKGDGDTNFYYLSIPDSIENAKKGSRLAVTLIEKDDQKQSASNPLGITRKNLSCTVEE